jgi:glucose-1-phosphate thymidylyltransferase
MERKVIGIIPAAGQATRLTPLPFSKELFPIGFTCMAQESTVRPKAVCQYLLERMQLAGIKTAFIVLREGKWDIPAYLKDGFAVGMDLGYLIMRLPFGVPYTLDQAYPFVENAVIALGFPDIIFQPEEAFSHLLKKLYQTKADVVLGLSPVAEPHRWDMVEQDEAGKIRGIRIKQPGNALPYGWFIAVWTPVFTTFMHHYLKKHQHSVQNQIGSGGSSVDAPELNMGDVFQVALDSGLTFDSVVFPDGRCIDIGTPENLRKAIADYAKTPQWRTGGITKD